MRSRALVSLLAALVLVPEALSARYSAQVQQIPGFAQRVKVIALAPIACPSGIDCLWLEGKLAEDLRTYGLFSVLDAERVRQALFGLGAREITPDNRSQIAVQLAADAIVIATIGSAGKTSSGAVGVVIGSSLIMVPDEVKHSGVEVVFLAPDGQMLLQGIGSGASGNDFKSQKGVVLTTFKAVFEKAFKK